MGLRGPKGKAPVKELPPGLLDASTWTIPCPSVLADLTEGRTVEEAIFLWADGLCKIAGAGKSQRVDTLCGTDARSRMDKAKRIRKAAGIAYAEDVAAALDVTAVDVLCALYLARKNFDRYLALERALISGEVSGYSLRTLELKFKMARPAVKRVVERMFYGHHVRSGSYKSTMGQCA